jgi:hypothetical protein
MTAAASGAGNRNSHSSQGRPTLDAKAIQRSMRRIEKTRRQRLFQTIMQFTEYSLNREGKSIRPEKLEPFMAKAFCHCRHLKVNWIRKPSTSL